MPQPEHFRKSDPQKHCGNCKSLKAEFKGRLTYICLKHDFTLPKLWSNKMLDEYMCNDADPYEKEPYDDKT